MHDFVLVPLFTDFDIFREFTSAGFRVISLGVFDQLQPCTKAAEG